MAGGSDIFLGCLAVLFPPLAVWIKTGLCSVDSLINILLLLLGYLPGLLHAWYIIAKYPDNSYSSEYEPLPQDVESGRVTYIYVQGPNGSRQQHQVPKNNTSGVNAGYGTTMPMAAPAPQQEQNGAWTEANTGAGEGSSAAPPPPTYAQAVQGDHKVQTKD